VVAISRNTGSYAMIASASLKPNADALRKLAQAAGNSVSTTQTTLSGQSNDLRRFVEKVSPEADAAAALETTRGLSRSADISNQVADALKSAQFRFGNAQSRNSSRPSTSSGSSSGAALVAMLRNSISNDEDSFDFSALLVRSNASTVKPSQISINAARQDQPDVFERGIPLTTAVGGTATTTVTKTALRAETVEVLLDKANPSLGSIQAVTYVPDGSARSDNEGLYVKTVTGSADDTVVLDTRDPTGDDSRLVSIDLSTGDGSDVIFIAGNNVSKIDAGAGDDFVAVEGDAVVDGGDGDDLIYARTASGDAGNDVIFSDGFASGGEGDDNITIFSLDSENDTIAKVAFGGAGDDQIVASVAANVDGGDGNDVVILRDGGSGGGGAGDDTLSAWANATLEGGEGSDDILLFRGGSADGGEGDDKIVSNYFASVSGGKGNDTVTMSGGGVYTFAKGDGSDTVEIAKARAQLDDVNKVPVNKVIIDGYAFADLTSNIGVVALEFTPTGTNATQDKLKIDREVLGKIEVVFRKNGQQQTLTIDGLTQTMGPLVPIPPS
jgi:Ca2+-binding RTX toxin-like protein